MWSHTIMEETAWLYILELLEKEEIRGENNL